MSESAQFQRTQVIRHAATEVFLWLDNQDSLRRGLNARSKPPLLGGLHAGSQIHFFIHADARKRMQHFSQSATTLWSGPFLGKKRLENG